MNILNDLLGLERMFHSEKVEEPSGPHGLHRIHFSEANLEKHEKTCRDAAAEIERLRELLAHTDKPHH
jgi:hypothetical protein